MVVGYIKSNIKKENLESKKVILDKMNIDKIVIDTLKATSKREKLDKLVNDLEKEDIIVVTSFEEIADNSREFLNVIKILKDKDINLISIKENFDTTKSNCKEMLDIFEFLSLLDKEYTKKQRKSGIESMKVNYEGKRISNRTGNAIGRPSKEYPSNFFEVFEDWENDLITAKKAMELTNLKRTTFYKLVKKYREEEVIEF